MTLKLWASELSVIRLVFVTVWQKSHALKFPSVERGLTRVDT